jgi:hypothetical protein
LERGRGHRRKWSHAEGEKAKTMSLRDLRPLVSKRVLPQQPQTAESIDTKFHNFLVRPVYLLRLG